MDERRPVSRRPRRNAKRRFLYHYLPIILTVILSVFCVYMVILTVDAIRSATTPPTNQTEHLGGDTTQPTDGTTTPETEATQPTQSTEPSTPAEVTALLEKAEFQAAGYDYLGAIALIQSYSGYENYPVLTDAIARYTQLDSELVVYEDMDSITHIFFHSLIVDADLAFDGDTDSGGYNMYMCTIAEFNAIMEQMYQRGFVLVSPYDVAHEVTDENGTRFAYGEIRLPAGKKPFILSQDDVNYYSYMISSKEGKYDNPQFADDGNDGFASRIVIGEDGYPTCEYRQKDGTIVYGDYDLVPLLETFIRNHPDFSYHGARAVLGVTGYEGVFGYRTKPDFEEALGTTAYQKEVEAAKAVAQCLKDKGWIIASHSYGHPAYGEISASRVENDSDKWENTVQPIVGETDVLLYPFGSDIANWHKYTFDNEKYVALYEDGYRYFFNVDSTIAWMQVTDHSFRGGRRNVDGLRMWKDPELLEDLFDVDSVFDPARPTPVPG